MERDGTKKPYLNTLVMQKSDLKANDGRVTNTVQSRIESFERRISSANPISASGPRKLPLRATLSLDTTKPYGDHEKSFTAKRDLAYSHSHDATVAWDQSELLPLVMEHGDGPVSPGGTRPKCIVRVEGARYTIGKL
jgi:hypothetical protein